MIQMFRELMNKVLEDSKSDLDETETKQLVLYGLLFEAAKSDHHVALEEQAKIKEIMNRYFEMDEAQHHRIKQTAEDLHEQSSGMFRLIQEAKAHFNRDQRLEILDNLWEIAFADGVIDPQETAILRRLADLLGLEHREFIDSKMKVATRN